MGRQGVDEGIQLDTAVRDWVFIPLTASIVLMKLLTQYAHLVRKAAH
jgi:hypothetical protein